MNKIGIFGATLAIFAAAGLIWLSYFGEHTPEIATTGDYKNATYIMDGHPITFMNGVAEVPAAEDSASKLTVKYFGNDVEGDINADGTPDRAFLITQDGGGSGTFFYVVAALQDASGGYTGTNAIFLGDRIAPQTTEIRNGQVVVNYADRKPGQPFTAKPSVGISRYFKIEKGQLVAASEVRY